MTKLWLDDVRPAPEGWVWAKTVDEAIEVMKTGKVSRASLDHDLGANVPAYASFEDAVLLKGSSPNGSGYDFVKWMIENASWPTEEIVVHSWNGVGARRMCDTIERYGPYKTRPAYNPYTLTRY